MEEQLKTPADSRKQQPATPIFKPAPDATPEELEEMKSRRRWTVGRNQAFADLGSQGSPQK